MEQLAARDLVRLEPHQALELDVLLQHLKHHAIRRNQRHEQFCYLLYE